MNLLLINFFGWCSPMSYLMKIVLVGNHGVGKTSYIHHLCPKSFNPNDRQSLGFTFCVKEYLVRNQSIKFQFWDLQPQTESDTIRSVYYYGALGALVMFDVTDPKSFANCEFWIKKIFKHNGKGAIPIILLGNKVDLRDSAVHPLRLQNIFPCLLVV